MSRLGTTTIRAGQVIVPQALSAGQQVTGAAVPILTGRTWCDIEYDIPRADQLDVSKTLTVFVEVSADGVNWQPRGFATTHGSLDRPVGRQPRLGFRIPPGMTHVRARLVVGDQVLTWGSVVRFL